MSSGACPCEETQDPRVVANPPGLAALAYRADDFAGFRRALLRPLPGEQSLLGWRPAPGDLGLQVLEWWAYLGDVLTFYNERIANEDYLRTAQLPAGVSRLVSLLGYRPRPAVAGVGRVAAIRRRTHPAEPLVVPAGFQLASTATPGVAVQTWEAGASSFAGATDAAVRLPPRRRLLEPAGTGSTIGSVLLRGTVAGVRPGDELLAISRSFPSSPGSWSRVTVVSTAPEPDPDGGTNTRVVLGAPDAEAAHAWMDGAAAADCRLLRARQTAALWTQTDDAAITAASDTQLQVLLAAAVRAIAPGDLVVLDGGYADTVGLVTDSTEIFTGVPYPGATDGKPPDIPVAHTRLTLTSPLAAVLSRPRYELRSGHIVHGGRSTIIEHLIEPAAVAVRHALQDVGTLIGSPADALTSLPATVTPDAGFDLAVGGTEAFLEDAAGLGVPVRATSNGDGTLTLSATADTPPSFSLAVPLRLLVGLVDVSRGKTVAAERLGAGDAAVVGQVFTLRNAPLTYLARGAEYVAALQVAVDGIVWSEAQTFYDQPPDATVYVVEQQPDGKSAVRFGDGVNGARLPTGGSVVASYRYGAGGALPPPGRLTTILKPQQNLAAVRNPLGVRGGADAERPQDTRRDAPRSVLTFGRAISADDYETVAALAPGVARARAYWTWDGARRRSLVKVYVGDDAGAAASARSALAGADDPNRPVAVATATPIAVAVACTLVVEASRTPDDVAAAAKVALDDLFAPGTMSIGRRLYTSQVEAALLVAGVVSVHGLSVAADGRDVLGAGSVGWADPGEGSFYALAGSALTTQVEHG